MKTLFDKDYKYTDKANEIDKEFEKAVGFLFNKYIKEGYSPRELEYLLTAVATSLGLFAVLSINDK